jgi:type IV pilus assembly protein PilA
MNTQFQSILSKKLAKGNKANGFTLIELMVVVAIVGVLSAVGLPQLLKAQDRAKISVARQEAVNFAKECSISLLTGAEAPDSSADDFQYDTLAADQACEKDVDVIATSDTDPAVTITVKLDGTIPTKPVSSED